MTGPYGHKLNECDATAPWWFLSSCTVRACMCPRQELDPVTLHNQALLNMDSKATEGFEKLAFLLQQPSFPPVTFGNLLLLYCKHEVERSICRNH